MDRALKERIVGAAILVVFIVLVVPVFLDGPADDAATVSEVVALPGQNSQQRTRQTIVLERDRQEPVPVGQASELPAGDARNEAPQPAKSEVAPPQSPPAERQTSAPDPAPAKVAEKAPEEVKQLEEPQVATAQPSTTGMWAVQLGSFSKKDNADRLAAELRAKGFAAFISQVSSDGTSLHRVRIGPQKDRNGADVVAAQLAKDGVKGQVVPHP